MTFMLVFAMTLGGLTPVMAVSPESVTTTLSAKNEGGDNDHSPVVLVSWAARENGWSDDSDAAYSQILPSGVHEEHTTIRICTIATDPDGLDDIDNVYTRIYYPDNIALGDHHNPLPGQSGDGCGLQMQQDELGKLGKSEGYNLFCNHIRNNNHNLPEWEGASDYDEICGEEQVLQKETAAVWCYEKEISYEDPSGYYEVEIDVRDDHGPGAIHEFGFDYLPLTAFEIDFDSIDYGTVKTGTQKIISGDRTFDPEDDRATVRNVGNTRLGMGVEQSDMGLGYTSSNSNATFKARIGSDASWTHYSPSFDTGWTERKWIDNHLDLSEANEMDFGITVHKFPVHTDYTGEMVLSGRSVDHLECYTPCALEDC